MEDFPYVARSSIGAPARCTAKRGCQADHVVGLADDDTSSRCVIRSNTVLSGSMDTWEDPARAPFSGHLPLGS